MSMIIGKALIAGGGTAKRLEFEYTGTYNERLDDGVVELLTSGVLKVAKDTYIDAFLVGGGGAGNGNPKYASSMAGAGGGGGYTKTLTKALLQKGVSYQISIGAGGDYRISGGALGLGGGNTTAFGYTVKGGQPSTGVDTGGAGGSGGGGTAGKGGSDGSDGSGSGSGIGGAGQGTTTREFGEPTGKLYAGGGGGGSVENGTFGAAGGSGGGGKGGGYVSGGANGETNTGGGGGGRGRYGNDSYAGSGGSGIVCIRLHKESA